MEASINAAVRRRDSLLGVAAASVTTPATEASTPAPDSTAEATASEVAGTSTAQATATESTSSTSNTTTVSQTIAQSVLASPHTPTQRPGALNSDMSKLAAALGAGSGNANNPIVVTLAERRYSSRICLSHSNLLLQRKVHGYLARSDSWYTLPYSRSVRILDCWVEVY